MTLPKYSTQKLIMTTLVVIFSFCSVSQTCSDQFLQKPSQYIANTNEIKIAYSYRHSIKKFDPHIINTSSEANLSHILFSTLVYFGKDGRITAGLAKSYSWDQNTLILEIRDNLKTIDGNQITSEDVYYSIKRNIVLNSATHGNLSELLGLRDQLIRYNDHIEQLRYDSKHIYITVPNQGRAQFLLPMLASIDFAIIPKTSIDELDPKLKLIDHRNTTGLYYVHDEQSKGNFSIKINTNHYLYSKNLIPKYSFTLATAKESIELFKNNKVDFIPNILGITNHSKIKELISYDGKVSRTESFQLTSLNFTQKAIQNFSSTQRIKIGSILKSLLKGSHSIDINSKPTNQFFPALSEGTLTPEQANEWEQYLKTASETTVPNKKIVFGVRPGQKNKFSKALSNIDFVDIVELKTPPWLLPISEQPDVYFSKTDSSFYESLSLLNYKFSQGLFGTKEEGVHFIEMFMDTKLKEDRLVLLRNLHLETLMAGYYIPLNFSPYYSVIRKPFNYNIYPFFAGTFLWEVTR